jgi:hypothetical protein
LNTDTESVPGALINQSGKSVAPTKKPAVLAKPKGAHTCFKKRYGSAQRKKNATRPRKVNAAK